MTPPAIAPRPAAPTWTVAVPFGLVAVAIASAWLSWQDDATFAFFSVVALACDIAAIVVTILGRRSARRLGAPPNDVAIGALVLAVVMLLGFAGLIVIVVTKPVVK